MTAYHGNISSWFHFHHVCQHCQIHSMPVVALYLPSTHGHGKFRIHINFGSVFHHYWKMTQRMGFEWQSRSIKTKGLKFLLLVLCQWCIMMCAQTNGSCINWISLNPADVWSTLMNNAGDWAALCPLPTAAPPSSRKLSHFSPHYCHHVCNLLSLGLYHLLHFVSSARGHANNLPTLLPYCH